ncbi:sensor histidine kinase [Nocardioides bizhenqiangii]|uniref:histidine kinase n=1 Tax=Nocardioides bizhenqiangii TaxID=3095076 RepID=A0ABZ0ZXL3_9ACTN|nr:MULTISPECIES: sensor histidine kinase [unclassified Nocardioides]MDZ5622264.1 sensor histidine kinase [Nocardioides sp. HM23]WQQ28561.1 sensor histidine kinase [Nocardioides sp. HM61]
MRRPRALADLSVARQILLLQVGVVVVLVALAIALTWYDARRDVREHATDRAVAVAEAVADSPTVRTAVASPDPTATLQPYAEQVRVDTDTDFVVVMGLDRTRYTHPNPDNIGKQFVGDLGNAPDGEVFTEEATGTLGPSVRAVVPVRDGDQVVALVSVGITVSDIDRQLRRDVLVILLCAGAVLAVGLLGAGLVSRRLRRMTHGMGEREIARMYEYYSAVLHAVREGLLLLDPDGRVELANDEARRLLGLPDDVIGRHVGDLGLAPGLVGAALGRTAESDDLYLAGDRMLVVSTAPARWEGREVGSVVSLRDHTELRSVTGELDVVRQLTESLRSQNHEAANRLHTVVSLIEMGRPAEAVDFATEELQLAQLLADRVVGAVDDPVVSALLLGKSAEAAERGIELAITGSAADTGGLPGRDLVTVLGNLVDNAFDAVADAEERRVRVHLDRTDGTLTIQVEDSGAGLDDEAATRVLERGWTTKAAPGTDRGLGLALVVQVARLHGGDVTIGRSDLGGARFSVVLQQQEAPA